MTDRHSCHSGDPRRRLDMLGAATSDLDGR